MSGFRVLGISWAGIGTNDFGASMAFFRDTLGLGVEATGEDQAILTVGDHGQQLEIFGREGRGKSLNSPPTFAFEVDDFDAALACFTENGIEIVDGPGEWEGHRWFYFKTNDGYLLEIKTSPKFGR